MPWYYAGPDTKPVGPISFEELQGLRGNGSLSPETYIIEYVGKPDDARAWKRYQEIFPTGPSLPALPPPPPLVPPTPTVQVHPLFPSAAATHVQPPAIPPIGPHFLPSRGQVNPWCGWGFGLGLASLILLLPSCGLTVFLALPALFISINGLIQVRRNHSQTGRTLALSGLILSGAALLITVIVLAVAIPAVLKGHGQITTTEQSTNDSE